MLKSTKAVKGNLSLQEFILIKKYKCQRSGNRKWLIKGNALLLFFLMVKVTAGYNSCQSSGFWTDVFSMQFLVHKDQMLPMIA